MSDILARLNAAGVDPMLIAEVAMEMGRLAGIAEAAARPDQTAEKRRAYDRERKRAIRPTDGSWQDLRLAIFERDNWKCAYCASDCRHNPHCDHIHPVRLGGLSEAINLTTACAACNLAKGGKTLEEFWA